MTKINILGLIKNGVKNQIVKLQNARKHILLKNLK